MNFENICRECQLPIKGKVLHALNDFWHPEHFRCAVCDLPILLEEGDEARFQIYDDKIYCEEHYSNRFLPLCALCEQPIKERIVNALDKFWHYEHFLCNMCGMTLFSVEHEERSKKVAAFDGMPYCDECFHFLKKPSCHLCNEPITDECISDLGFKWHPSCFQDVIDQPEMIGEE